ncbi:MAG: hypothetical protein KC731_07395 [Myxococcales bacterium]|nr:hypothetical protein [Myxococcales bacterium]
MLRRTLGTVGLAVVAACSVASEPQNTQNLTASITEAEADAVIDLVNEASLVVLDDDVGLDKRAAENIVAHRDGADATPSTSDDDPFDDIEELDAVPYVGPSALDKLVAYVHAQGLVDNSATPDDVLILWAANESSLSELDVDAGLDKRAAENIVAHRDGADGVPSTSDDDRFDDIAELDAVPYVGPAALAALLAYAKAQGGPQEAPCLIISEYIEGQGNNNKAIEIYNCGSSALDLEGFGVCLVRNEATSCTTTAALPASSLAPGAVRTLCRTKGGTFNDPMQHIADRCDVEMPGVMTFNGDDRIALFRDADGDGSFGPGDSVTDMLGRFGYQPPVTTWQDLSLRRCNFTPSDGESFYDHADYFTVHGWGQQQDYGYPPVEGCGTLATPAIFADDLRDALVGYYALHGTDIAMMGGNDLADAQAAVSLGAIVVVSDPEDNPTGYDLGSHQLFSHPDVIFPGSDTVWFGAYAGGSLVEVTPFN